MGKLTDKFDGLVHEIVHDRHADGQNQGFSA